jgi:hypothetical protein
MKKNWNVRNGSLNKFIKNSYYTDSHTLNTWKKSCVWKLGIYRQLKNSFVKIKQLKKNKLSKCRVQEIERIETKNFFFLASAFRKKVERKGRRKEISRKYWEKGEWERGNENGNGNGKKWGTVKILKVKKKI